VHNVLYDNSEMVNTKIKEVEKIEKKSPKSKAEPESESEESDSECSETDEAPLVDEYEEFRKQLGSDSESEPELE